MEDLAEILALDAALKPQQERMLQIFSEACRLFAERGFEGASMRDIAAVCGILKATLYHYFADNDAIVRPLMLGTTRRSGIGRSGSPGATGTRTCCAASCKTP
jgi:hypothetical protein